MKPEFLIEKNGRTFALYAGLLDEAHSRGLKAIRTSLVQIPGPDNGYVAIAQATVTMLGFYEKSDPQGLVERVAYDQDFEGTGDASSDNVSKLMAPHIIRMAETRAKARALRDAINIGEALLDDPTEEDAAPVARPTEKPRMAEREFSKSPEGQAVESEIAKLKRRYAALILEAAPLKVNVHPIPANATVDQVTDLGVDLRNRIDEAKARR